jgi:hypothetical protein
VPPIPNAQRSLVNLIARTTTLLTMESGLISLIPLTRPNDHTRHHASSNRLVDCYTHAFRHGSRPGSSIMPLHRDLIFWTFAGGIHREYQSFLLVTGPFTSIHPLLSPLFNCAMSSLYRYFLTQRVFLWTALLFGHKSGPDSDRWYSRRSTSPEGCPTGLCGGKLSKIAEVIIGIFPSPCAVRPSRQVEETER